MQGVRVQVAGETGYRDMDRSKSLRWLFAAGSVLIALARVAPADVVATTFDAASAGRYGGGMPVADLSQSWSR
jgi:hypothetical protein